MPTKRIAVIGGAFDPPHFGHLALAESAVSEYGCEKVIFIPTGNPPHKDVATDPMVRLEMTRAAIAGNPRFELSDIELRRGGTSYTLLTINELTETYPGTELCLIVGADMYMNLSNWYKFSEWAGRCTFLTALRPGGADGGELHAEMQRLKKEYGAKSERLYSPALRLSSTELRQRIRAGLGARYLVPDAAIEAAKEARLYYDYDTLDLIEGRLGRLSKHIKAVQTPERYTHSIGVCSVAAGLAAAHGVQALTAVTAALVHDCVKCYTEDEFRRGCAKYGIKEKGKLRHAPLGAEIARDELGILDKDVLDAVRYHTTGRAGMSKLEKIVYIADCIEPGRLEYTARAEIEALAYKNLDTALARCAADTAELLKAKGKEPDPNGNALLKELGIVWV